MLPVTKALSETLLLGNPGLGATRNPNVTFWPSASGPTQVRVCVADWYAGGVPGPVAEPVW